MNIAQSRGDAVMGLLERAEIAPLPAFYGLLYDYVAGVRTLDAARFASIVEGPQAGRKNGERLYDEFVRPYQTGEALDTVIANMVRRLETLDAAIVERHRASTVQSAALEAATTGLSGAGADRSLMLDLVTRLADANEVMRTANAVLVGETAKARADLATAREELGRLSRDSLIDPLTTIANRKGLDGAFASALAEARDGGGDLAVAVIDIDRFKQFNDQYGHQTGDEILRLVARALLATLRTEDVVGRMGGDEFIAIMRNCPASAALERAEEIRRAVLACDLAPILGSEVVGCVTVSVGVATHRQDDTMMSLIERADRRLLEAKGTGRNRVFGEPVPIDSAEAS